MKKDLRNRTIISKRGNRLAVHDKRSGMELYHVIDTPVYEAFDLDTPFLSGMASVSGVPGNYYSFHKYLATNDDNRAIASDWKNVGIAIWDSLFAFKFGK